MTYFTTAHSDCVKGNTKKKVEVTLTQSSYDSQSFTFISQAHIL